MWMGSSDRPREPRSRRTDNRCLAVERPMSRTRDRFGDLRAAQMPAGTGGVIVRRLHPDDELRSAVDLFIQYLEFYGMRVERARARDFLEARLEREESVILLADLEGLTVGFLQAYPGFSSLALKPLWVLNDLFVLPLARMNGVGRVIVRAFLLWAREQGA